jgi:hypothetical protein
VEPAKGPGTEARAIEHRAVALPAKADGVPDFARPRIITVGAVAGIAVAVNAGTIDAIAPSFADPTATKNVLTPTFPFVFKTASLALEPIGAPGALHHSRLRVTVIGL